MKKIEDSKEDDTVRVSDQTEIKSENQLIKKPLEIQPGDRMEKKQIDSQSGNRGE